jgi:S-adenosylmethionine:tRNA-ribosyltransferase-isomerase (queuine synthetase)
MLVRDFDFTLPPELIAQTPAAQRGLARLLHLARATGEITHTSIASLPDLLVPGDVLTVNDSRVFPARLLGRRVPSGGAVECLLVGRSRDQETPGPGSIARSVWKLINPGCAQTRAGHLRRPAVARECLSATSSAAA